MDYIDYDGIQAASNKTGFKKDFWFAPKSWFLSIKESTTSAAAGDTVTVSTAHTFNTGKGWVKAVLTEDTTELDSETIGDNVDSQNMNVVLKGFLAGLTAVNTEIVKALIQGEEVLVMLQDCNLAATTYIQLGNSISGLTCKATMTGGKRSGGVKGWNLEFRGFDGILFYTSTLTLKP